MITAVVTNNIDRLRQLGRNGQAPRILRLSFKNEAPLSTFALWLNALRRQKAKVRAADEQEAIELNGFFGAANCCACLAQSRSSRQQGFTLTVHHSRGRNIEKWTDHSNRGSS